MIDITCEEHGDVKIILIDGEFYLESVEFAEEIWNEQVAKNPTVIAFNCANIKFVDSSAIGILVKFLNISRDVNIELIFFDLSETLLSIFKTAKLENFFKIMSKSQFEAAFLQ